MDFLKEGPVVAFVPEGYHAIEVVRKIVRHTEPRQAAQNNCGDFATLESYAVADEKERVLRNLVHASDSVENADREIKLWFKKEDLYSYNLFDNIQ